MILFINDVEEAVNSIESLSKRLASIQDIFTEIWLEESDGPSIACFKNDDRCFLMYLRESGDSGFTTRSQENIENGENKIEFILSNGQRDEYPVSWTIPYSDGRKAIEYFYLHKDMLPELTWHED